MVQGEETAMTHHPPPASQATAREVVGGWNDKGRQDKTRQDKREEVGGKVMTPTTQNIYTTDDNSSYTMIVVQILTGELVLSNG